MICKMNDSVVFYSDYCMYLLVNFILYIKFVHFVWFRNLQQIQKLIFIFYFSINFMFLENEIKGRLKFYKKIIFVIWSLYSIICKMNDSVEFYSDYPMYSVAHFILYIKLVHFVWFRNLQQIQKLIFVFYFSINFMFLENEIKVRLKFYKKNIFVI